MPSFRGIEVAIVCGADGQALPEFAHQDGSSVKLAGSTASSTRTPSPESFASSAYSDATDSLPLKKSNPTISVYIPSLPGRQWWLRYNIHRAPHTSNLVYFKLFVNGINITNWGVDLDKKTSGTIARALYEPCERWHYRENGTLFKREGIEARTFCFMPDTASARRIGDDGGLFLVQVYRAKARRPRAVKLDTYRAQERWGIASPSGGLLDAPEDAVYYDFLLVDCKESPYATFGFHYRSWRSMTSLNLVSPQEAKSYTAILEALNLVGMETEETPAGQTNGGGGGLSAGCAPPKHALAQLPRFADEQGGGGNIEQDDSAMPEPLCITKSPPKIKIRLSPPERFSTPSSPTRARKIPQPSKARRDLAVPRNTVVAGPRPLDGDADNASRKSSESHAPSIAPSLLQVLDGERLDGDNDGVEYGVATQVVLSRDNSQSQLVVTDRPLPSSPQQSRGLSESDLEYALSMSRRGECSGSGSLDDDFIGSGLAVEKWTAPRGQPPSPSSSSDNGGGAIEAGIKPSCGSDEWF